MGTRRQIRLLGILLVLLPWTAVAAQTLRPLAPVPDASRNPLRSVLAPNSRPQEVPPTRATVATRPLPVAPQDTASASQIAATPNEPATVQPTPGDAAQVQATPLAPTAGDALESGQPSVSKDKLAAQLQTLEKAEGIEAATKTELVKLYQAALESLAANEEAAKKAAQYQTEVKLAPELVEKAKVELAQPTVEPLVEVPADATLPQLEQRMNAAEADFNAALQNLTKLEEEIKRRGDRKGELTKLVDASKQRREEASKQLAELGPNLEGDQTKAARTDELRARLVAIDSQVALYKAEAARLDALAELFPLQRDLAKREKNLREKELAQLQQIVARFRQRETELQARQARRQLQMAHPALRALAERNAELAESRQQLADSIESTSAEATATEKQLQALQSGHAVTMEKVDKAGHSATVGLILRKQREQLPQLRRSQAQFKFIGSEVPKANLARIELQEERDQLGDMDRALQDVLTALQLSTDDPEYLEISQTARELLTTKRDLLDKLVADYDSYFEDLNALEVSHKNLVAETQQIADYIDQHVLWIRSAAPISTVDVRDAAKGVVQLAAPQAWLDLAKTSGIDAVRRPVMGGLAVCIAITLLVSRSRLLVWIRRLCETKSSGLAWKFRPTVDALLLAAASAAAWPLLAAYFGWRFATAEMTTDLGVALGSTLQYAAILLWFSEFTRLVCRTQGIAEAHFGWSTQSVSILRREVRWLTFLGMPLACVVVFARSYDDGSLSNSLGRFAFLGGMLLLANFAHALLGQKENIFREAILRDSGKWLDQVRTLSHYLGILLPIALGVAAAVGYYYSAMHLAERLQLTLAMVLGFAFLHALISRWFLVERRKLAMENRRRQQQLAEANAQAAGQNEEISNVIPVVDQAPDLSALHQQLHLLLRHAITLGVLAGSWYVWVDVLPAFRVLDRVELWETHYDVTRMVEGADGVPTPQVFPETVVTTLSHALLASGLLAATFVLGRYLPALLEITVLSRLPIDKGGRHAISVILRYTLGLAGIFFAGRVLNFTWSSLQWLAAGMTVGLGFGLQEIFANFVAGLILLLERPIRVGDIITLGDVTGTVTDIRVRATTVTNWDRKELIVPNKDLITGRLLNWTLSDTTNRIVIEVGVAYKSDPDEVRRVLLSVLDDHPSILKDPTPNVTFEGFGDSTLNFVLRAYLSTLDVRLTTIHEIHATIHRRLGHAGIEIAFPQRDINIRGLEQVLPALPRERPRRTEAA